MTKKIMIIAAGYFIIILIVNSCDYGFCKDVEYYDFSEVQIQIENSNTIESQDSLIFKINQLDTRYMAQIRSDFNIIKSAYALNCDYGSLGMKIPLTKIEITSNSDFNQEHPANTLLNDIIIVKILEDPNKFHSEYHFEKFDSVEFEKLLPRVENFNPDIYIAEHPTIDSTHRLRVKIFKSNGETIITESEEIYWN